MQACKHAKMQGQKSNSNVARIQEYQDARMQGWQNLRLQNGKNTSMQAWMEMECKHGWKWNARTES